MIQSIISTTHTHPIFEEGKVKEDTYLLVEYEDASISSKSLCAYRLLVPLRQNVDIVEMRRPIKKIQCILFVANIGQV